MRTFADRLVEEGFRQKAFAHETKLGRTCQLHLHKWKGYFRPMEGEWHSVKDFWVPVGAVIKFGEKFCFAEELRFLQWEKQKGFLGRLFETSLALGYGLSDRHQTGVMLQSWLNPSPTLTALSGIDFDEPFTIFGVNDLAGQVDIIWFGSTWKLELSAFTFSDLILDASNIDLSNLKS